MVKNPPANAGDVRDAAVTPGLGRCPGGGHGNPLQCSCLESRMTEEPGGLQSRGLTQSDTIEARRGDSSWMALNASAAVRVSVLTGRQC